jgi:hypothetical protein
MNQSASLAFLRPKQNFATQPLKAGLDNDEIARQAPAATGEHLSLVGKKRIRASTRFRGSLIHDSTLG